MLAATALLCGLAWIASCGSGIPRMASYRIVDSLGKATLLPPETVPNQTEWKRFPIRIPDINADCALREQGIRVEVRGNRGHVFIQRDTLTARPPGWLPRWVDLLSERGCLPLSQRRPFVRTVLESYPLDLTRTYTVAFGQFYSASYVDFRRGQKLKVVGPVFRDGTPEGTRSVQPDAVEITGKDGNLSIAVRSSRNLIGYEESWYSIESTRDGVLRASLERTTLFQDGEGKELQQPTVTRFRLVPESRFVRMIYFTRVADASDHDVLIVSAARRSELEDRSRKVRENPSTCNASRAVDWCMENSLEVSFNLYVEVEYNGVSKVVIPGIRLGSFLTQETGMSIPQPLERVQIRRPYRNRLISVDFDPSSADVLSLPLQGGEEIRFSQ